ncbi:PTS sugar transporter subunit IIB [Vagococcus fluvialis]|jgi:PTS system mannose-specific IIB component|uniref:PTS mannose/fructose/sorbose transporter subunit IIAB n=1 Tax=Vagococcus fluvialis TaxID=2738 RepID=UPI001A8D3303|nr:PTS mannose/fructose/sorbose transporter subunit IIAB [Vagococcus fluvialis]MBO0430072.1 PTS sugar transporter subunit IIB [Vagococcus fluvialis]
MKKIVIASHEKMAKGIQSTLELFIGSDLDVTYMSAYVDDEPAIEEQIETFFNQLKDEDQAVIFTDMFGGSVNQKMVTASQERENVFIIAGFNLPVVIEVIYGVEVYTHENLKQLVENGKNAMQLVESPTALKETISKEVLTEIVDEIEIEEDFDEATIMSTTLRVDERLIHGQIAMVWSRELNLDGILVANDEVAENETQQMALKMAVPSGVNVLIRSIDEVAAILKDKRAKKKNLLVLVRTIQDAYRLAERVKNMSYINIGNVGKSVEGNKKTLTQFVMLTEKELVSLEKLVKIYPETALQNVPSDKKELAKSFIK